MTYNSTKKYGLIQMFASSILDTEPVILMPPPKSDSRLVTKIIAKNIKPHTSANKCLSEKNRVLSAGPDHQFNFLPLT